MTLADDSRPLDDAVAGLDRVALVLGGERQGLSPRWGVDCDPASTASTSLSVLRAVGNL
jgi:tRNA G18 (ribose-2'-O)-methylase SpoU